MLPEKERIITIHLASFFKLEIFTSTIEKSILSNSNT